MSLLLLVTFFFFFNDTATTEIYTLSLHDALPISVSAGGRTRVKQRVEDVLDTDEAKGLLEAGKESGSLSAEEDRKSTRLNSSHSQISYAVFCLKKKKKPR